MAGPNRKERSRDGGDVRFGRPAQGSEGNRALIDVADVLEAVGDEKPIDGEYVFKSVGPAETPIAFASPVRISGKIENVGSGLLVTGDLSTSLKVSCSRCLETAEIKIDQSFGDMLYPVGSQPDEEDFVYEGRQVDLGPMIEEITMLAVPIKPLCRADCKGLCGRCGANLNEGPCGCPPENVDMRLAKLKEFFEGRGK